MYHLDEYASVNKTLMSVNEMLTFVEMKKD
jgi:hypothetical protein